MPLPRALSALLLGGLLSLLAGLPARLAAPADSAALAFLSPYASTEPLERFLVFAAPPRDDIPDGQLHWVDLEVPGIDVLGPDGGLHNMCPDGGLAWTLHSGDPYGGGNFVAVECQGRASGWQMLAFHLCEVGIQASIDNAHRLYTPVPGGADVARECGHTHLSLGYWAGVAEKRSLPCPQWYVQGRYWVNPACLARASALPAWEADDLAAQPDWELRFLTPQVLTPLRSFASAAVVIGLGLYLLQAFVRRPGPQTFDQKTGPAYEALLKSGVWLSFLVILVLLSAGPIWPVGRAWPGAYLADPAGYQALAGAVGYGDWRLLQAFYQAGVPRGSDGRPAGAGQAGKVFPPEAAAAIPFGETDAQAWGAVDPTAPGVYGRYRAWDAVAERWPASMYERLLLEQSVSRTAQRQRAGLQAIASSPDVQQLARRLGKTIRAEDLYGSSAGALGRTQILPEHFAPGGLCGDLPAMDVWNDPQVVAECTTRYLTVSGCWGRWWDTGDVWSALCGYNPGAWGSAADQWYWSVLQDRLTRLRAAAVGLEAEPPAEAPAEANVSTPALGLLAARALLDEGRGAARLPEPLAGWVAQTAPEWTGHHDQIRLVYRLFRAWTLLYYTPDQLAALGIQP